MSNKENVFSCNSGGDSVLKSLDIESYQSACGECSQRLQEIWLDMEVPQEQISGRLRHIQAAAVKVWEQAVNESEEQRNEMRRQIENAIKEIRKIQDQLGEACVDENLRQSTGSLIKAAAAEAQRTMKSLYDEVMGCLSEWKKRKDGRVQEFEVIHKQVLELKRRLGQFNVSPLFGNTSPNKFDISQAHLEFLILEQEKLQAEKNRRERKLEAMLSRLRKVCIELGEDDLKIVQSVHPSLFTYRDSLLGQQQLGSFNQLSTPPNQKTEAKIELGDQLFKNLQAKFDEMQQIKIFKEERLSQIVDLLTSLWTALKIPESDTDREIFSRLLQGGAKLHDKTMERCMGEVQRLEGQEKQQMVALIHAKERELQQMCDESHLIMPDMSPLVFDIQSVNAHGHGQVTNVMSKMMRMVDETKQLLQKRYQIVKSIEEVNLVKDEVDWLTEYEMDDNRFKGRDSNRKLQRSIKASKQRERLPHVLKKLQQMIEDWESQENMHFQFDNYLDYKAEVLEPLYAEVQQQEQDRQKGHKKNQKQHGNKVAMQPKFPQNNNKQEEMRPHTAAGRLNSHQLLHSAPPAEPSFAVSSNTPRTPRTHQLGGGTCLLTPIPPSTENPHTHNATPSFLQSQQAGMKAPCNILQDKLNRLLSGSPIPPPQQRQHSQEEVVSMPMECSQGSGNSASVISGTSSAMASFKAKMMGSQSNLGFSVPRLPIPQNENVDESRNKINSGGGGAADMMVEDENMEP